MVSLYYIYITLLECSIIRVIILKNLAVGVRNLMMEINLLNKKFKLKLGIVKITTIIINKSKVARTSEIRILLVRCLKFWDVTQM